MVDTDSRDQTVAAGVVVVTISAENPSEKTASHCDMYPAGMYMHIHRKSQSNDINYQPYIMIIHHYYMYIF